MGGVGVVAGVVTKGLLAQSLNRSYTLGHRARKPVG
jgi:hypothetical protein